MFHIERVGGVNVLTCPVCRAQEKVADAGHRLEACLGGVDL